MIDYNLEKLVSVSVIKEQKSNWYKYRNQKKFLGIVTQKEGIYYCFLGNTYEGLEAPEYHTLRDGIIYEKPMVILYFTDKSTSKCFDTYEQAESYANNIKNQVGLWLNRLTNGKI